MKKNKTITNKIKSILIVSGMFALSSPLLASYANYSEQINSSLTTKVVSQVNKAADTPSYSVLLPNSSYYSYSYNNEFASTYNSNFGLGVNTTSENWTNGYLKYDGRSVIFQAWYQNTANRSISGTLDVDADPWGSMQTGNIPNYTNQLAIKRTDIMSGNDQFKQAVSSMKNTGSAITWDGIKTWNTSGSTSVTNQYTEGAMEKSIISINLNDDSSVSAAINVSAGKSTALPSNIRYDQNHAVTDHAPGANTASGLSTDFNSQRNYAGMTFTRTGFDNIDRPGSQQVKVYSGDTKFPEDPIQFNGISISDDVKRTNRPSDWLRANNSQLAKTISISMQNGYPGCLANALTLVADDKAGTISAVFQPKKVLLKGCAVDPSPDQKWTKVLISGFNEIKPDNTTNGVANNNNNSSLPSWIWIIVGVGSLLFISTLVAIILIVLKNNKRQNQIEKGVKKLIANQTTAPRLSGPTGKPTPSQLQHNGPNGQKGPGVPQGQNIPKGPGVPQGLNSPKGQTATTAPAGTPKPPIPGARPGVAAQRPGAKPATPPPPPPKVEINAPPRSLAPKRK